MTCSIGASLIYGLSFVSLMGAGICFKKTDKKISVVSIAVITFLLACCLQTFEAGLMNLVHIPINIISVGIFNWVVSVLLWILIYKKKERQKLEFKWVDLIFVVVLIIVMARLTMVHYGGTALLPHYWSIDAGNHFRTALDVIHEQEIGRMFYDTLWNSMLLEFCGAFTTADYFYKIYVFGDVIGLALAAAIIYVIARAHMKNRFQKVAGMILPFVYMLAYPLNSTIFGFSYLGMGVTIIGLLVFLADRFMEDEWDFKYLIVTLMLGCLALFETYMMFIPVVYLSLLLCVAIRQKRKKELISWRSVRICLEIFLIPCLMGMWYAFRGIFSNGVTVTNAIANEGGCYRDLYSNFIFFIPLAFVGFYELYKRKEHSMMLILTPLWILFTLFIFMQTMTGSASSYYYYKMYYPLWLIFLILNVYGVMYAEKQLKYMAVGLFGAWLLIVLAFRGEIEARVNIHNPNVVEFSKAQQYIDIYSFNYGYTISPRYDTDKLDLYHYVYQEIVAQGGGVVPGAIDYNDSFWYQDCTDQFFPAFDFYNLNTESLQDWINEEHAEYLLVMYDSVPYMEHTDQFDEYELLYENNAGFVVRIGQ